MRNIIVLIFLIFSNRGYSNHFDKKIADSLKWDNTKLASLISDAGMSSMLIAPYYFAFKDKQNRKERITTSVVMHLLNFSMVDMVKERVKRERPSRYNRRSFYSGHTSTAFTSAGLLCAQDSKTVCLSSLAVAASVGYFRIAGNWHWASDVLVGMGVGFYNGRYIPRLVIGF